MSLKPIRTRVLSQLVYNKQYPLLKNTSSGKQKPKSIGNEKIK